MPLFLEPQLEKAFDNELKKSPPVKKSLFNERTEAEFQDVLMKEPLLDDESDQEFNGVLNASSQPSAYRYSDIQPATPSSAFMPTGGVTESPAPTKIENQPDFIKNLITGGITPPIKTFADIYEDFTQPKRMVSNIANLFAQSRTPMLQAKNPIIPVPDAKVSPTAQNIRDFAGGIEEKAAVEDPGFFDALTQGGASIASLAIPGAGLSRAMSVPKVLASMIGLESLMEGSSAKERALQKGMSLDEAQKARAWTTAANIPIIAATQAAGPMGMLLRKTGKKAVKETAEGAIKGLIKGSLTEGVGQELPQQIVGNLAVGDPALQGAGQATLIGSILGGGMGGAVGATNIPQTKKEFKELKDAGKRQLEALKGEKAEYGGEKDIEGIGPTRRAGDIVRNESGKPIEIESKELEAEAKKYETAEKFLFENKGLGVAEPKAPYKKEKEPFKSNIISVVQSSKMPNVVSGQQAINILNKGISKEEIEFSGVEEFLKEKGKISKQELADYMEKNKAKVETTVKSKDLFDNTIEQEARSRFEENFDMKEWTHENRGDLAKTAWKNLEDKSDYKDFEYFRNDFLDRPLEKIYSEAELKEMLDEAYDDTRIEEEELVREERGYEQRGVESAVKYSKYTLPGGENYQERLVRLPEKRANRLKELRDRYNFYSSHWDEPNVLVHLRTNDRTDSEGKKVLFVEEIQSDWHREGKKKGYSSSGVPSAPFKNTWHELGLKEAINVAVDGGYDKISWISGDQTADRYDLSKQVDSIGWYANPNDTYNISYKKDGNSNIAKNNIKESDLADVVGKGLADKIIGESKNEVSGELSGLDLKVGGEWANKFYDQILPRTASKYIKKWGGKVEGVTISREMPMQGVTKRGIQQGFTITPEMRKDVLENGQPLFGNRIIKEGIKEAEADYGQEIVQDKPAIFSLLEEKGLKQKFDTKLAKDYTKSEDNLAFNGKKKEFIDEAIRDIESVAPAREGTKGDVKRVESQREHTIFPTSSLRKEGGPKTPDARRFKQDDVRSEESPRSKRKKRISEVVRELKERGVVNHEGRTIGSPQDAAELAAVFRHPKIEQLQTIYLKDGKVVAHNVVSSGDVASINVSSKNIGDTIIKQSADLGADTVYIAHNHPGGNPTPSQEDYEFTKHIGEIIKTSKIKFEGNIVTNHETYTFIDQKKGYSVDGVGKLKKSLEKYSIDDKPMASPHDVAEIAKDYVQKGKATIIFLTNQNKVISIDYVGLRKKIIQYIRDKKKNYGAKSYIIIKSPSVNISQEGMPVGNLDIIEMDKSGVVYSSLEEQGKMREVKEEHGSVYKVQEPSSEYGKGLEEDAPRTPIEKQSIQEKAEMEISQLEYTGGVNPLEYAMKDIGKIKAYKDREVQEYKEIPNRFKNKHGKFLDEARQELESQGFVFDSDSEFIMALKELGNKKQRFILSDDVQKYLSAKGQAEKIGKKLEKQISPKKFKKIINSFVGLRQKSTPVIIKATEKGMLKQKLKKEESVSKKGYKAGVKEQKKESRKGRSAIISKFKAIISETKASTTRKAELVKLKTDIVSRSKIKQILDVKKNITQYVIDNLPKEVRGKYLRTIENTKTFESLSSAFRKVDKEVDMIERKDLIAKIKDTVSSSIKSSMVSVEYKGRISDIIDGLDLVKRTPKTMERLRKLEIYIKSQVDAGKTVVMPQKWLDKLKILYRNPVKDMSIAQLKNIVADISLLIEEGRLELKTRKSIYKLEKENIKDDIINGTLGFHKNKLFENVPGGKRISIKEKLINVGTRLNDVFQDLDLVLTPMDTFFDLLDGGHGRFDGTNYRNFKARVDSDYQEYMNLTYKYMSPIAQMIKDLKLNDIALERVGIHAANMQVGGYEKLLDTGLSEKQIKGVKLNESEMKFYKAMRKVLDDIRPEIARTMKEVYNKPLANVENYFSFLTDFEKTNQRRIHNRVVIDKNDLVTAPTKKIKKGFTIKRTLGKQAIKLNAWEIFSQHMDNAAYLVKMSRDVQMLFEIANSPEYFDAAGDVGSSMVIDWLDLISRKGGVGEAHRIRAVDWLRRNTGAAKLGFKASSILIQPTALLDGAAVIGGHAFDGFYQIVSSKEKRDFVKNNMPEVRERIGDDPAYNDFGSDSAWSAFQKAGYAGIRFTDSVTAAGVAYGAYSKKISELGLKVDLANPNKEAISYAQEIVRRTQSSALFKDAPLAISKGKGVFSNRSLNRAFFQFQTFVLGRFSNIKNLIYRANIKGGRKGSKGGSSRDMKAAALRATMLMAAFMAETAMRRNLKKFFKKMFGDETEDKYDEGFVSELVRNMITTIPFTSPAVSMWVYKNQMVTSWGAIENLGAAGGIFKRKSPEAKLRATVKTTEAVGTILGVPGVSQAAQFSKLAIKANSKESVIEMYKNSIQSKSEEHRDLWKNKGDKLARKLGLSIARMEKKAHSSIKRKRTGFVSKIEERLHDKPNSIFKKEIDRMIKSGELTQSGADRVYTLRVRRLDKEAEIKKEVESQ